MAHGAIVQAIGQLGFGMVNRLSLKAREADRHHVGVEARGQLAPALIHSQGFRPPAGGHAEGLVRWQGGGIPSHSLSQECADLQLPEHGEGVIRRRAVRPQGHPKAGL